ncbi:MAG: polymerase III, subunit gamma and tau, DNA polymerase III subunit gamma/tau protein [Microgenomates group bacterium GW2011_GWC1_37_8]|uniref:DNA polymerase III subunit gamma/tau n=1 Tax=Candidatus Woesebacteria bacterium GW2011_GWB1_38_8 TaxID=1618570 RepID=A0A0G0NGB9_9BACT|nr:MAG: polymerase III, subunit gamma and tau, DNA polymerase III subunit gamma/tau protein [Microgenomates group bacterium GW2011_GWC1_37_8]KKQ84949.1 MAG: polymerase III, tau subunit protein [Candidatus Woesebacteria bacterium GW2011_GWB1_38_8]
MGICIYWCSLVLIGNYFVMTFYLKYRSQTLDELDLVDVRETLKKYVTAGSMPHAFLFAGPRGTGKTSAARILAKILNCENPLAGGEPCNNCEQCKSISKGENLDVYELDAASHRGIDDVRILREAVKLAPVRAKKKVYIIDEAHMLTTEAANALLKTLEEPPDHVMFILATTNPEKLIDTVRSRTVVINFRKARPEELVRSLSRVAASEKLKFEAGVLELISKTADGSFRDAVKILEQILTADIKLNNSTVSEFIFSRKSFDASLFLTLLAKRDIKSLLGEVERSVSNGVEIKTMIIILLERLRAGLMSKIGINSDDLKLFSKQELIQLIELLLKASNELSTAAIEQLPLELSFVEWCDINEINDQKPVIKNIDTYSLHDNVKDDKDKDEKFDSQSKTDNIDDPKDASEIRDVTNSGSAEIENVWADVLSQIRPINASTEALLRAAKPINFDGKKLTLGVYYKFHKERLESNPHRDILETTVGEIIGMPIRLECTLTDPPIKKTVDTANGNHATSNEPVLNNSASVLTETEDEDIIKVAKDIFGS